MLGPELQVPLLAQVLLVVWEWDGVLLEPEVWMEPLEPEGKVRSSGFGILLVVQVV